MLGVDESFASIHRAVSAEPGYGRADGSFWSNSYVTAREDNVRRSTSDPHDVEGTAQASW